MGFDTLFYVCMLSEIIELRWIRGRNHTYSGRSTSLPLENRETVQPRYASISSSLRRHSQCLLNRLF